MKLENPNWIDQKPITALFVELYNPDAFYVATNEGISESALYEHPIIGHYLKDKRYNKIHDMFGDMEGCNRFFLAVNADCAWPPHYLVCCDSESDVEDIFIDECDACLVEEPDLADYKPLLSEDCILKWDSNGKPHDTESLIWRQLKLVALIYKP
jgi:hypothetical protein